MLSTGVSPVGPTYKANIIEDEELSMHKLTATRETVPRHLGGYAILDDLRNQVGEIIQFPAAALYVGVTKSRRISDGTEIVREMQIHEVHKVLKCHVEYLDVKDSLHIENGDDFRFYISDSQAALSSRKSVYDKLMHLKLDCEKSESSNEKVQVFGGIIFCCRGRGSSFYGEHSTDSSPFVDNFPRVTFVGTYCSAEIARGDFGYLYDLSNEEDNSVHCNVHSYSAIYLVMSYRSPIQKSSRILSSGVKDCSGSGVVKLQD
ncbi:hypothetical protein ACP275_09G075800 [Erythranthe tilingii]